MSSTEDKEVTRGSEVGGCPKLLLSAFGVPNLRACSIEIDGDGEHAVSSQRMASVKVDLRHFIIPKVFYNPSRWLSARSARHHRNRSSKRIPRRGITLCATPDRGRPKRRLLSGCIACRLNHRLRLLHSSGMLKMRSNDFRRGPLGGAGHFIWNFAAPSPVLWPDCFAQRCRRGSVAPPPETGRPPRRSAPFG
jgi:hypothetical protein